MSKRTVSHEGFIFQRLYSTVPNGTTLNLWCTLLTCSLSTCHQLPPLADLSHTDKIVPTHTHSYCIVSWGAIMRASTHTHTSASVCVCVCVCVCLSATLNRTRNYRNRKSNRSQVKQSGMRT